MVDFANNKKALYTEDLRELKNFKVAFDADLLLSKVTKSNALKSIQDGHGCLDIQVQQELSKILSTFKKRYEIEPVVVIEGLKPACLVTE